MQSISKQTQIGYYGRADVFKTKARVTMTVENIELHEALRILFEKLPIEYELSDNFCYIRLKPDPTRLTGKVVNEFGAPIKGASVIIKNYAVETDSFGRFSIDCNKLTDTIIISHIGYEIKKKPIKGESFVIVEMPIIRQPLDVVWVSGNQYQQPGMHDKSSIYPLADKNVNENFLDRLLSRNIGALFITRQNGMPGSDFQLQLRGQSSIGALPGYAAYNFPLIVVDGVPFAADNSSLHIRSPLNAFHYLGSSPLANIDPHDIEKIIMIKDADATILYGSRGANGVILINTKRGKSGTLKWNTNASYGIGQAKSGLPLLNTQEYRNLRWEAFRNDNIIPTRLTAPDLIGSDTTHFTDFPKMLSDRTVNTLNLHMSVSGGFKKTQYYFSGGYNHDISSLPRGIAFQRISANSHLTHLSDDDKFSLDLVNSFAATKYNSVYSMPVGNLLAPPYVSYPDGDSMNRLGTYYNNTFSTVSRLHLKFKLTNSLRFTSKIGYNKIIKEESGLLPLLSRPVLPGPSVQRTAYSVKNTYNTLIAEPQMEFTGGDYKFRYEWLLGSTWQRTDNKMNSNMSANELFITNANITGRTAHNYIGHFSNFLFRLDGKYIANLTLRRDWSDRLQAGKRFGNFGALGLSWIFSGDSLLIKPFPFINYGKLKVSYGISGNEQAGLYDWYGLWPNTSYTGQRNSYAIPTVINEDYTWQVDRKLEFGLELRLFRDKVLLDVDAYYHRTGNQVLGYPLFQTGVNSLTVRNSSAVVQNKGIELTVQFKNIYMGDLQFNWDFGLTIPKTRLLSFPDLSTSPYANTLVVGQSLTVLQGFQYTGVNPATGLFEVADLNKDGLIDHTNDYKVIGNLDPKIYGNAVLDFSYKNWSLNILLNGRVQKGSSVLWQIYAYGVPGADLMNLPAIFLDRWQKPGDQSSIQRLSASRDPRTMSAINNFLQSDAGLVDASFIRLSNICLVYELSNKKKSRRLFKTLKFSLQADNLLTITKYKGADPETQNIFTMPPLKKITIGVQCDL